MAAPATRASIPPERAPAGCDWLIQTHLQRNASLRVPVGVQFKSAAPGAWGQAGAGSEDDSCAGAFPKAAVGFLKRVFRPRKKKRLQEYPLGVQRSSPQPLRRRASPFPILRQPDFGRERNPKTSRRFPPHSTPPPSRKSKDLGRGQSDLSATLPKRLGEPGRAPAADSGHLPPSAPLPRRRVAPQDSNPQEASAPPKFREIAKEGRAQG